MLVLLCMYFTSIWSFHDSHFPLQPYMAGLSNRNILWSVWAKNEGVVWIQTASQCDTLGEKICHWESDLSEYFGFYFSVQFHSCSILYPHLKITFIRRTQGWSHGKLKNNCFYGNRWACDKNYFQLVIKWTCNFVVCCVMCAKNSKILQVAYVFFIVRHYKMCTMCQFLYIYKNTV
jgi:hypothetical protein